MHIQKTESRQACDYKDLFFPQRNIFWALILANMMVWPSLSMGMTAGLLIWTCNSASSAAPQRCWCCSEQTKAAAEVWGRYQPPRLMEKQDIGEQSTRLGIHWTLEDKGIFSALFWVSTQILHENSSKALLRQSMQQTPVCAGQRGSDPTAAAYCQQEWSSGRHPATPSLGLYLQCPPKHHITSPVWNKCEHSSTLSRSL